MTEFFNTPTIIMIFIAVLLAILLVVVSLVRGGSSPAARRKKVSSVLRSFAGIRKYRVLDGVVFTEGGRSITADHVLVGYFGLLFVSDLTLRGDYYGGLEDEQWVCNTPVKDKEVSVRVGACPNPLHQNQRCMEAVRARFARAGVYNIQMDSAAVAAWPRSEIFITGSKDKVMNLGGLRGYLGKDRFSKDSGVDVEKLCALLTGDAE